MREIKKDSYCARRIEFSEIEKLAKHWEDVKANHRYLEEVLTHEFLNNNIHLNEKERQVAKECVKMVGDFYQKAENESILMGLTQPKIKNTITTELKYRRD